MDSLLCLSLLLVLRPPFYRQRLVSPACFSPFLSRRALSSFTLPSPPAPCADMFLSKTLVVLSVALSALAGPGHAARGVHHRDIAHRAAMPIAQPEPLVASARRRADTGRCKAHSSAAASPTVAPLNVESDPATTQAAPSTTKHTTAHATVPTHAASSSGDSALANFLPGTNTGEGMPRYLARMRLCRGANHDPLATFYMTGLTACGVTNKDTDYIAAVSHLLFDTYPYAFWQYDFEGSH